MQQMFYVLELKHPFLSALKVKHGIKHAIHKTRQVVDKLDSAETPTHHKAKEEKHGKLVSYL